jgi:hypothetical protein
MLDKVTQVTMAGEGAHGAATGYESSHPGADEFYGFNSWQDPEEYTALKKLNAEGKINSPEAAQIVAKSIMRRGSDIADQFTNKAAQFAVLDVTPMRGTDVVNQLLGKVGSVDDINKMSSQEFAKKFGSVWESYERSRFGNRSDLIGGLVDRVHRDTNIAGGISDNQIANKAEDAVNKQAWDNKQAPSVKAEDALNKQAPTVANKGEELLNKQTPSSVAIDKKALLALDNLRMDALSAAEKASTGETAAEKTERILKGKEKTEDAKSDDKEPVSNKESRGIRSTKDHPVTINNTYNIHSATGDPHAIADAVDKHMSSKVHEHARTVIQHLQNHRETLPA